MERSKMIKKKIISSALVPIMLASSLTSVQAKSFWDSPAFTNYTAPAAATDPETGTNYYSGGSYFLKFKSIEEFPPVATGQGPDLKTGCNGVSFNLGFASLINFEQLSNQLSQAGASLAWGLLIGLAYSLPALKEVFDTINEWSARLQNLLANACQAGIALSKKEVSKKFDYNKDFIVDKIDSTLKDSYIEKKLDEADEMFYNLVKDGKATPTDLKVLKYKNMMDLIKSSSGGIVSSYLTSLVKTGKEPNIKFDAPGSTEPSLSYKVEPMSEAGFSDETILMSAFILSMISDIKINISSSVALMQLDAAVKSGDNASIANALKKFESQVKISKESKSRFTEYSQLSKQGTNFVDFLLNGEKGGFADSLKKMNQPSVALISRKYTNGKIGNFVVLSEVSFSSMSEVVSGWKGIKYESAELVKKISLSFLRKIHADTTADTATVIMPFLVPERYETLKNVIILLKPSNGVISIDASGNIIYNGNKQLESLMNMIAKENALVATENMLMSLENIITVYSPSDRKVEGSDKELSLSDQTEDLSNMWKLLSDEIDKQKKELNKSKKETSELMKTILDNMQIQEKINEMVGVKK